MAAIIFIGGANTPLGWTYRLQASIGQKLEGGQSAIRKQWRLAALAVADSQVNVSTERLLGNAVLLNQGRPSLDALKGGRLPMPDL